MPHSQKKRENADSPHAKEQIPRILIAFDPGRWKFRGVLASPP
jgi:hypothetical protein